MKSITSVQMGSEDFRHAMDFVNKHNPRNYKITKHGRRGKRHKQYITITTDGVFKLIVKGAIELET